MHQEVVTISDVEKEKRFPLCMQELRTHSVRSYSVLPLSTSARGFGALGLGKSVPEILDSEDLEFFRRVAFIVSLALENQQAYRAGEEQRERLQGLVTIGQELSSSLELERPLPIVFANLRQITSCDYAVLALLEEDKKFLRVYAVDQVPGLESLVPDHLRRVPTAEGTAAQAIETRSITFWSAEDLDRLGNPRDETNSGGWHSIDMQRALALPQRGFGSA